jgi:hypothetical protein
LKYINKWQIPAEAGHLFIGISTLTGKGEGFALSFKKVRRIKRCQLLCDWAVTINRKGAESLDCKGEGELAQCQP